MVVQNLIPVVDMHSIFYNPQASASWLANDILILCACKDQAMFGCLVLIMEFIRNALSERELKHMQRC